MPGNRSKGRPRKISWETVSVDIRKKGSLNRELAQEAGKLSHLAPRSLGRLIN